MKELWPIIAAICTYAAVDGVLKVCVEASKPPQYSAEYDKAFAEREAARESVRKSYEP